MDFIEYLRELLDTSKTTRHSLLSVLVPLNAGTPLMSVSLPTLVEIKLYNLGNLT